MTDERATTPVAQDEDDCSFAGGRPETTDELKARGRFRLRTGRQRQEAERREREEARLELAILAEGCMRQALPRCLWEFTACAVEGPSEQMAVSIRLPRHPRIFCHLEPSYDNGHKQPTSYHLPRRPGRFGHVGDLAEPVETIEEALALA